MIQRKQEAVNFVPAEPGPEESAICRILIRLPQGQKLERRFHRTIHTLRVISDLHCCFFRKFLNVFCL